MTSKEIIHRILDSMDLEITKGNDEMLDPILPWFIMDIQYQIFCSSIKPLNCGYTLQKLRSLWNKKYNQFNKSMFVLFNDDEKCEIVDMMEEFEQYISNDVEIAKIQFMNVLKDYDLDIQDILASGMMCNALAQNANIIYKKVYALGRINVHHENPDITGVEKFSLKFTNVLHKSLSDANIKFNGVKPLEDAMSILQKKMIRWIKNH